MIKKLVTVAAASTFLIAATGAFAQDATNPPKDATGAAPMTTTEPTGTTDTTGAATTTTPAATTDSAEVAGTYLTEQSVNQISADDYIGATVYNAADKSIGEINDLILEKNGGIVAAVIGVGGFLGIGEKDVAVPMSNIMVSQKEDGSDLKLTTSETSDSLKAAPEFKTLAQTHTASEPAATTGTVPSATGTEPAPAPADPAAPAAGTTTTN